MPHSISYTKRYIARIVPVFVLILMSLNVSAQSDTTTSCSLNGARVLITAPGIYASRFASIVDERGGSACIVSTIDTHANPDTVPVTTLLDSVAHYQWIVLPSRTAIDAFFASAIKRLGNAEIKALRIAAIGRDADYMLKTYGVLAALVPPKASPEGIAVELSLMPNTQGKRIAVVAPLVKELTEPDVIPVFLSRLKAIGMHPTKVEAYVTQPAFATAAPILTGELAAQYRCVVVFTSTAETEAFIRIVGVNAIRPSDIVACFGPYTASNVKRLGLPVHFTGTQYHAFDAFIDELCGWMGSDR